MKCLFFGVVIIIALVVVALGTATGREYLTEQGLARLPLPTGMSLTAEAIQSPSFGHWLIQKVHLSYSDPAQLTDQSLILVENFELKLGFSEILSHELSIQKFLSTSIEIWPAHFPASETKPMLSPKQQFEQLNQSLALAFEQLQALPLVIEIQDIKTESLTLHGASPVTLAVQASASAGGPDVLMQGSVSTDFQNNTIKNFAVDFSLNTKHQFDLQASSSFDTPAGLQAVELHGQVDFFADFISIQQLAIKGLKGSLAIAGQVRADDLALDIQLSDLDIEPFLPEVQAFTLDGQIKTAGPFDALTAFGELSGLGQVQGQQLQLNTTIDATTSQVKLQALQAQVGTARFSGAGHYVYADRELKAHVTAQEITTQLAQQFGVNIPAEISFKLKQADVDVTSKLNDAATTFQVQGTATGKGFYKSLPVELKLQFQGDETKVSLNGTQAQINETVLALAGQVHTNKQALNLSLNANNFSQKTLNGLGLQLPATSEFSQNIRAELVGPWTEPQLDLSLKGKLAFEQLVLLNECIIQGDLQQIRLQKCAFTKNTSKINQPYIMNHTGTIGLDPFVINLEHDFQNLQINHMLNALPRLTRQQWRTEQLGVVVNGKVQTALAQKAAGIEVSQVSSNITLGGKAFDQLVQGQLQFKVGDVIANPLLEINKVEINYGQSQLLLQGNYQAAQMDLKTKAFIASQDFELLPFEQLSILSDLPSQLRLQTSLKGSLQDPQLDGSLNYQLEVDQGSEDETQSTAPYTFAVAFTRKAADLLRLEGSLGQGPAASSFQLQTNALALLALTQTGLTFDLSKLKVQSKGELDLASVNALLNPVLHNFSGFTTWQARYEQEVFEGDLQLKKGQYEHLSMYTKIKDITLNARFDLNGLEVVEGSATDGVQGRYTLKGYVQNPAFASPATSSTRQKNRQQKPAGLSKATNLQIRFADVKLLNRPDIELAANGSVHLTSALVQQTPGFLVKGALALQPLAINLDQAQTSGVDKLNVRYVKKIQYKKTSQEHQQNKNVPAQTQTKSDIMPIALDIALKTDQQAFLRGKGIDAELGGNINVLGTVSNPQINGYYKIVRGRAEILGKRFALETGELRLNDGQGILNLKAVHKDKNQQFIARVAGSLQSPQVTLTSEPPMPEDETVSRLLFGKSLGDVTAVQTLRIAAAVRSLSTSGGFDPIASTREVIGVDQVSIESDTNESGASNYKVGVGKYVSDRVYVEIERSSNAIDPWQGRVEVDLTDTISVETSAQGQGVSGVDINWKRDY